MLLRTPCEVDMNKKEAWEEFINILTILNYLQFELKLECDNEILIGYKSYFIENAEIVYPSTTFLMP